MVSRASENHSRKILEEIRELVLKNDMYSEVSEINISEEMHNYNFQCALKADKNQSFSFLSAFIGGREGLPNDNVKIIYSYGSNGGINLGGHHYTAIKILIDLLPDMHYRLLKYKMLAELNDLSSFRDIKEIRIEFDFNYQEGVYSEFRMFKGDRLNSLSIVYETNSKGGNDLQAKLRNNERIYTLKMFAESMNFKVNSDSVILDIEKGFSKEEIQQKNRGNITASNLGLL